MFVLCGLVIINALVLESTLVAGLMHPRQLPLQHRRIRLHQALHTAGPFRAGNRADTCALADQRVLTDLALHLQQVTAVLGQGQRILGDFGQQQVDLANAKQVVTHG